MQHRIINNSIMAILHDQTSTHENIITRVNNVLMAMKESGSIKNYQIKYTDGDIQVSPKTLKMDSIVVANENLDITVLVASDEDTVQCNFTTIKGVELP